VKFESIIEQINESDGEDDIPAKSTINSSNDKNMNGNDIID